MNLSVTPNDERAREADDGLSIAAERIEPGARRAVLRLRGRIDCYHLPRLERAIEELAGSGVCRLVLSCSRVDYISRSAIVAIYRLSRSLEAADGSLVLAEVQPGVRAIMEILGFTEVLPFCSDVDEAMARASRR